MDFHDRRSALHYSGLGFFAVRGRRLIDANTELSVPGLKSMVPSINPIFFIAASDDPFQALLSSFPELTNLNFLMSKPTYSIKHHIEIAGPPAFSCPRRLCAEKLRAAKADFYHKLQLGIIRPSKRSADWRLTGDFRRLNAMTVAHPTLSRFRLIAARL